ncbi:MAG: NAD+ synthase [Deltaproteobacteria bacterium]|nr:NAD+ synthase [Deltaproteobacteria bacterium]
MRIALAQVNPTVGDFEGNAGLVLARLTEAEAQGARLCVFPEMCLAGYPPHDLLERPAFVARNLEALAEVARHTARVAAVVGFVAENPDKLGKRLQNAAALLAGGQVVAVQAKTLLPTYDVFDERRYFEPARFSRPVELDGVSLGLSVCEDIWNNPGFWPDRHYDRDPIAELVAQGADVIVNISASPFTLEKRRLRPRMLEAAARHYRRPIVFVNQVGGNDDLVFDGASLAFGPNGRLWARAADWAEDLVVVDTEAGAGDVRTPIATDEAAALEALTVGVRDYARKCGFKSAVLGLSGGIDSSLVAAVGARALGPKNVLGVAMPSRYSSQGSLTDAVALAKNLGIRFETLPIDGLFQGFLDGLAPSFAGTAPGTAEENLQARVRGTLLMALSNKFGHLLLTTGNKSELATGYCTLYGDMAGGLAVVSDVPKTLVYRLCAELNREREVIPSSVIDKPPSAELRPDQKDEDSLPPYPVLDAILDLYVEKGLSIADIAARGHDERVVREVARLVRGSEYKRRQAAPGIKITAKAFGPGRRMPVAERFEG